MADAPAPRGHDFELGTDGPHVIVAGVDGSPTSLRAGAYAAGLARRQRARLVVAHVATAPVLAMLAPGQPWPVEEMLADAEEDLRAQVRAGADHAGIPVDFVTARGEPFGQLSRIATELRADAVVVGASTRAGHRIVGSLGGRLVRAGKWPVVIVP